MAYNTKVQKLESKITLILLKARHFLLNFAKKSQKFRQAKYFDAAKHCLKYNYGRNAA